MNNENKAPVLTLEHIAPYLPYGVEVKTKDGIFKVAGWVDDIGVCLDTILYGANAIPEYKLILRPLSDLSSYNERFEESWISRLNKECIEFSNADGIWLDSDLDFDLMYDRCEQPAYLSLEYASKCIDWLIKNHFDLFGLIEKGLAVDINSIEGKETKGNG